VVERGGFEPPKAKPTDLQSAPFDRFGTSPAETSWAAPSRSTVFEVKIKSEETLPSRSLLPAIVKEERCGLARSAVPFSKTASRVDRGALACGCYSYPVWIRVMIRSDRFARPWARSAFFVVMPARPRRAGAGDGTRTRNLLITNQLLYH
jgi:hypothetical protein